MRKTAFTTLHQMAREDERIVFIGSDLTRGVLEPYQAELPQRFFMEGVSEAHLVGMAAGLASTGRIVYLSTIATFLTRRCFEQIAVDACLHRYPVRLIALGGGLVYAPLGPTHNAIEDIAILRALPGMTVLAPADAVEMAALMRQTADWEGPIYIRVAKGGDPVVTDGSSRIGRAVTVRSGGDILFVSTGITLQIVLGAAERLAANGIESAILHVPTVKPLDVDSVISMAQRAQVVLTVEEHSVVGGLGSAIAEVLAETDFKRAPRFKRVGLRDAFIDNYGSQAEVLASQGIDVDAVARTAARLLEERLYQV